VLVTASKSGFATERRQVKLGADARLELDLVPSAPVSGIVLGPNGQPLSRVAITATDPDAPTNLLGKPTPPCTTSTDEQGGFTLDGLAPGRTYELAAVPQDKMLLTGELEVVPPRAEVRWTLGAAGALSVAIDVDGDSSREIENSWPGVELEKLGPDGSWAHSMSDERTAAGATVTFRRLDPGTYRVHARPIAFTPAISPPVTVVAGETASLHLPLTRGRTVTGRIVDTHGNPIPQSRVGRGDQGFFMMHLCGDDGRFKLPGFTDELSWIVIGAPGGADRRVSVPGGVADLGDLVVEPQPAPAKDPDGATKDPEPPTTKAPEGK
jgi:hypothetical protein